MARRQPVHDEAEDDDTDTKRFATLQARCALLGAELHQLKSGGLLLVADRYTRHLNELSDVARLLGEIGA